MSRADGLLIVRSATSALSALLVLGGWAEIADVAGLYELWLLAWAATPLGVYAQFSRASIAMAVVVALPTVGYAALWAAAAYDDSDTSSTYVLIFLWLPVWGVLGQVAAAGVVAAVERLRRRAA